MENKYIIGVMVVLVAAGFMLLVFGSIKELNAYKKGVEDGTVAGFASAMADRDKLVDPRFGNDPVLCRFSVGNEFGLRYSIRLVNWQISRGNMTECELLRAGCNSEKEGLNCVWNANVAECVCNIDGG